MRRSTHRIRRWSPLLALLLLLAGAAPSRAQTVPDDPGTPTADAPAGDLAAPSADATPELGPGRPLRLVQSRLGIDAPVVPLGVDADGAMAAPSDPDTVGWWSLGADTSVEGNVVLAGHVNWAGSLRTFGKLFLAQPGDVFYVTDAAGTEYGYVVTWTKMYDVNDAPLEEVFLPDGPGHQLTLITCGGRFDRSEREYLDRLVVRAQRIEPQPTATSGPDGTGEAASTS